MNLRYFINAYFWCVVTSGVLIHLTVVAFSMVGKSASCEPFPRSMPFTIVGSLLAFLLLGHLSGKEIRRAE